MADFWSTHISVRISNCFKKYVRCFRIDPNALITTGITILLLLLLLSFYYYLKFLAQILQSLRSAKLYVDLPGYLSPGNITGDNLRPDVLLSTADNILYIIELTVGFETNLNNNANRKELKYRSLRADLAKDYNKIKFVNLSVSCFGIFGNSSESFLQMCSETGIDNRHLKFIISKLSNKIIRTTYYIFCMRNKP